ncbi:type II secretion system F family protein [Desulfobacula toluolica]|uniref:Predicted type II secretion system protein n=1 Tax=Desulfobacula toluolica (strain DSM 7467 / Tol2) TaxID=651182 RepID=K0NKG4_DESTT|nr:type II secretion system F family protein [Desulfobacula toluolica]CCK80428.1 predicted type II secretion system protein [Desulfobacula toluolica Tol2]
MLSLDQNFSMMIFPLFFVAFFLLCMGIIQYSNVRKKNKEMINKIKRGGFDDGAVNYDKNSSASSKKSINPFAAFFSLFSKKSSNKDLSDPGEMKIKFLRAGLQWENAESAFWGAKLCLPLFFVGCFILSRIFIFKVMADPMTVSITVLLGLFGFYLPEIWLKQKTDKRKEILFKGLPDALDLLLVCVEAGMGLDSAMNRVGQELRLTYPDLSREFSLMNLEMRAGKMRQDALRNLARRTGIDEMASLVTLLIQTDKFGTSVGSALKVFSDSFRTKRFQKAEEIAAKLPVNILFPLILFIFPSLFVVILGPAAITIYNNIILK